MVLVQTSFHITWPSLFEMELELTRLKWKWTRTQTRTRGHETHPYDGWQEVLALLYEVASFDSDLCKINAEIVEFQVKILNSLSVFA